MRPYNQEDYTDWFGPEIKPVHHGPYLTVLPAALHITPAFQYWDGVDWGLRSVSANSSVRNQADKISSRHQNVPWRGLKVKPEEIT